MKEAAEILEDLSKPWNVQVQSTSALAGAVAKACAKDDAQRQEKLRRKPALRPLPAAEAGMSIELTPWEIMHALGRATSLSRQGAGRGVAGHWNCLKYCEALEGTRSDYMTLSQEGLDQTRHYRTVQSSELAVGFATTLAERIVRRLYPGHSVSIVDADVALQAGWVLRGQGVTRREWIRLRPNYFIEVWKPGGSSTIIPLACRGTHGKTQYVHTQLAGASAQVEAFHVGAWNQTPSLVTSAELLGQGGITVHALHAKGNSSLAPDLTNAADQPADELHLYPEVRIPNEDEDEDRGNGFQVLPEHYAWFRRVVIRTGVAGLMAFVGGGNATAKYLTKRQGREQFEGFTHAGTGIVQDVEHRIGDIKFVGTDHVFRLNRTRVEAFSGVAEDLFLHLHQGEVEQYRREVHALRLKKLSSDIFYDWGGPVSLREDGSIMAMRLLRDRE